MDSQTWDSLAKYKKWGSFDGEYPYVARTFFAPYDDVHAVIMTVLGTVKQNLYAAMFGWDDAEIDAFFRTAWGDDRIRVKIALDSSQTAAKTETACLRQWPQGSYLNALVIGQSSRHAISHDKILIADDVMITGSTNLSKGGQADQNNELTCTWNSRKALEGINVVTRIFEEMAAQPKALTFKQLLGSAP